MYRSSRVASRAVSLASVGIALLSAACGLDPTSPSATSLPSPTPVESLTDQESASARFRIEFGLNDSLAHIRSVEADPSANRDYGVALLPSEVAEIEGRSVRAEKSIALIEAYGSDHQDDYGGLYLDHERDGVVVVLFTDDLERHILGVWDAVWDVSPGVPIQFREVAHSERALSELQSRIASDTPGWQTAGVEIVSVIVDIVGNQVEIGVVGPAAEAEPGLAGRYGADWIRVVGDR
jgi:hypothetical protein